MLWPAITAARRVADLAASCTMNVVDIKAAIVEACNNAQDLGAKATDTLGLGLSTEMSSSSKAPDADGDGLVQADTTYAAVTYGKDGKITSRPRERPRPSSTSPPRAR